VEVGLVDVAALGGNARGGVTRREKVSGVVEAHQLRGAFGCEADLGSEAGPQALAAPADLLGQAVDPYPPSAGDRPPPGVDDLRIDRRPGAQSPPEDVRRDREPFVPRRGGAQPLLDLPGVADPDIFQGYHGPGELGRCAENHRRDDRRQPDLEALAPPSAGPKLAREEPGDEAAALVPAVGIVDDASCLAQVDDQGDRWVRDHGDVRERGDTLAEPGHADPRQLA
jgi:hypothetical protein